MKIKGGMTDYYEQTEKRKEFAEELRQAHPDVVKVVWRYNRWHHQVDYRPFKNRNLEYRDDYIPSGEKVNNYGMVLKGSEDSDNESMQIEQAQKKLPVVV